MSIILGLQDMYQNFVSKERFMKKVMLFVMMAMLVVSLLVAAVPTKMARLTVINKSGSDVYLKLTGSEVTESFYYLTVPSGDRDEPTTKVYTIMQDVYTRETVQCEGLVTDGQLVVSGNLRLTFTPCDQDFASNKKNIAGEPTMEKVTAFRYLYLVPADEFSWSDAYKYDGYHNYACTTYAWRIRTYKRPVYSQCLWRYQY